MDTTTLIQGAVTVGVGALSGGVTNAVAIWMLFHPYEPTGPGPLKLHGAIPKNKSRLARSIGKTVGERLLTPADITSRLNDPAVRRAFDDAIGGAIGDLLERERGSLEAELPPDVFTAVRGAIMGFVPRITERAVQWSESPDFTRLVEQFLERLEHEIGDRPLAAELTEERRGAITLKIATWVRELADNDELEATLRGMVQKQLAKLAGDDTPLIDRLPSGLVGAVEAGIADYLPMALERLGDLLSDPAARSRVELALRQAFDHSVRELLLHERILAKLMVTDRTIERLVDGFEAEGFDRFADALHEPGMKQDVSRAVNDAVVNFLRTPLGERLRALSPERRDALEQTLGDWLVRVARDDATRDAIARAADRLIGMLERRTWGDALRVVPRDSVVKLARSALANDRGQHWIAEAAESLATRLLTRPIGRPARWLPDDTAAAVRQGIVAASWARVESEIPRIVQQLDVQGMVEQKVLGFSTQRMEEIVRGVTQRELNLIVRLGYVLGALVGLVAFGINLLFR